jgi:hypothetical protein
MLCEHRRFRLSIPDERWALFLSRFAGVALHDHNRVGSVGVSKVGDGEMNEPEKLERQYLAEADQHIADATERTVGLQAHIADLEREGRDAAAAREALQVLQATLQLMVDHRAMIARLLETLDLRR